MPSKIHHPLLGEVDLQEGPSVLEDHAVRAPAAPEPVQMAQDPSDFPAPEPVAYPPSARTLAVRLVAGALRRLAERIEQL